MNDSQFKCARCGGIFDKEVTDEEALDESRTIFGSVPIKNLAVVCDDCFNKVIERRKIESN